MKLWTSAKADKEFSSWIRNRDGKCMRCGKTSNLQCSHFFSRSISATRYDPENCVALCAGCHLYRWERMKNTEYLDFMLKWLGEEKYGALRKRAYSTVKRSDAIRAFQEWITALTTTGNTL